MSYDDIIYIILIILLLILVERVFLNELNFTEIKSKLMNGLKNSMSNGNKNGETIKEGFNDKPFKHRGEGSLADNKKKDKTGSYEISEGDEQMIQTVQTTYTIAEQFAYMTIKMPYQFLNKIMQRLFDFVQNINDIIEPILNFAKQMINIVKRIFMKFFNMGMKYLKQFFAIMGNLPEFIRRNADMVIDLITTTIMSIINFVERIAKSFEKVLKIFIELPSMIFKLLNQLVDLVLNLIFIILKLPSALIGMVISLQEQGLSLMDKSFGIPFMDLFFK
jgi:hypothetical protein